MNRKQRREVMRKIIGEAWSLLEAVFQAEQCSSPNISTSRGAIMNRLWQWLGSQGKCALAGALAGTIVGFIFELLQFFQSTPRFGASILLRIGVLLSLAAWLAVILFLGAIAEQGEWAVVVPSLVTSLITGLLTVFIDNQLWEPAVSVFTGIIIGFLVGKLLCRACLLLFWANAIAMGAFAITQALLLVGNAQRMRR